ncbi:MAG: hypothetical protein HY738_01990 [Bacteroidia bacterium]|nr:hypothetical protein [Bacteroidia bacterium]
MNKIKSKKVNVGCGQYCREGWINIDIQPFKTVDVVMDVTKEWKFQNLTHIYAEHFIEHLSLEQGMNFLVNAGKSLGKNGLIRLSTPNIEWVLKTHYKFDKLNDNESALDSVTAINRAFHGWNHKFLYSPFLLKELLIQIGFKNINFKDYKKNDIPEFKGIEEHISFAMFAGSPSVIIIEAEKSDEIIFPTDFYMILKEKFIKYDNAVG